MEGRVAFTRVGGIGGELGMGVRRDYFCCLCRDRLPREKLHGIQWAGKKFTKTYSANTERHLCQNCVDSAAALAEELHTMRPEIPTAGKLDYE